MGFPGGRSSREGRPSSFPPVSLPRPGSPPSMGKLDGERNRTMRALMAAITLFGAVAFAAGNTGSTNASKEGGDQGAKELSQQMEKAWNGHDAKSLSSLFTDKGTLISPFGDKGTG